MVVPVTAGNGRFAGFLGGRRKECSAVAGGAGIVECREGFAACAMTAFRRILVSGGLVIRTRFLQILQLIVGGRKVGRSRPVLRTPPPQKLVGRGRFSAHFLTGVATW